MRINNYWYILLFILLPLLIVLLGNYLRWKQRCKSEFSESQFHYWLFGNISFSEKIFPFLYILAFVFLILSILDFIGDKEEIEIHQKTHNVLFLLDVSNSMNAEDVAISRLESGKNIIINSLKKIKEGRVGIVVFAGEARSIMPLTTDTSAAETYVEAIESTVIRKQGTDFLEAIKIAVQKFQSIPQGDRTIVMISDGEDNEGHTSAMIEMAKKEGISVLSIGIGTEEGAPIPEYYFGQLMGYKENLYGEIVISKLQKKALQDIATATNGLYIDGNDMEQSVKKVLDYLLKQSSSTSIVVKSHNVIHYYQYFLVVSLVIFFIIFWFKMEDI